MNPSPILRVLSTLRRHRVQALLMGGQACILYGGAEFSRDVDVAVGVGPRNVARLRSALTELEAEPVYFPELSAAALQRGHACHFRCHAPGCLGVRLDVMASMRGAPGFETLWRRRTTIRTPEGTPIDVLSLPDLVAVKKTQRDKDWPMVRRLVESDVARNSGSDVPAAHARFWLRECRTPELLIDLVRRFPRLAASESGARRLLRTAAKGDAPALARELRDEEDAERERDREYWAPLRAELERMRLGRR